MSWHKNIASPEDTKADVALEPVQVVVCREGYARVIQQVVLLFLMVMQKAEEHERTILAVWSRTSPHVVDVAIQLGYKDVYVLAAVVFWKPQNNGFLK